jgi:hypothetical protein
MSEVDGPIKDVEGSMNELKTRWQQLTPTAKLGVGAAAVIVGLIVLVKILPALVAGLGIGLLLVIFFIPYWIPTIIAFMRKHPSKGGILALNFFFGWTFVGWVVSLAWALSDNSARAGQQTVIVNTHVAANAATPSPAVPVVHQVGDVVNGHRFDGVAWVPLPAGSPPPPTVGTGS